MPSGKVTPEEIESFVVQLYLMKEGLGNRKIADMVEVAFDRSMDKTTVRNILERNGLTGKSQDLVRILAPNREAYAEQGVVHFQIEPRILAPQAEIEIRWSGADSPEGSYLGAYNESWVGSEHVKDLIMGGVYSFPVVVKIDGQSGFYPLSRGMFGDLYGLENPFPSGRYLVQATIYGPQGHYGSVQFEIVDSGSKASDFRAQEVK